MTFGSTFGRIFSPTFQPNSQAIAGGWWLSGGIDPANCVAAYQAKGAASYAASKVNLANPGTHDLTDGTAYPAWDASTGWSFTKANSQYLISDINVSENQTDIVRIANVPSGAAIIYGSFLYSGGLAVGAEYIEITSWNATRFQKGNKYLEHSGYLSSGCYALSKYSGYKNSTKVGSITDATWGNNTYPMHIGRRNGNTAIVYFGGDILAFATYNIELTSTQIGLLVDAMAAL